MSLAAAAISETAISDAAEPGKVKGPPPKRTLVAIADPRQTPEPR